MRATSERERRQPAWRVCISERARLLEHVPELERRQVDLVEAIVQRSGLRPAVLNVAYDVANEVGLDPVLALELVGCGVSVLELETPEPIEDTASTRAPAFVVPPIEPPGEMKLERHLRLTFRRMRTSLEENTDLQSAIERFLAAPDVGAFNYDLPTP